MAGAIKSSSEMRSISTTGSPQFSNGQLRSELQATEQTVFALLQHTSKELCLKNKHDLPMLLVYFPATDENTVAEHGRPGQPSQMRVYRMTARNRLCGGARARQCAIRILRSSCRCAVGSIATKPLAPECHSFFNLFVGHDTRSRHRIRRRTGRIPTCRNGTMRS